MLEESAEPESPLLSSSTSQSAMDTDENQGETTPFVRDKIRDEMELDAVRGEGGWTLAHRLSTADYADVNLEGLAAERLSRHVREGACVVDAPAPCPGSCYTALLLAAQHRHWQIVKELLELGASAGVVDQDNMTVLHHLARADDWCLSDEARLQIVKMLMANGVDMDARDLSDRTAVQLAAIHREWRMVHTLVSAGASVDSRSFDGYTLFHHLALASLNKKNDYTFVRTMTEVLLQHGLDINRRTEEEDGSAGDAPIHIAARVRNWDMVGMFLQHGADPTLVDAKGLSVLHRLGTARGPQCVEVFTIGRLVEDLIKKGLDVDLETPDGKTALDLAADDSKMCVFPTFWDLLRHGATIKPTTLIRTKWSRVLDQLCHLPQNTLPIRQVRCLVRYLLGQCLDEDAPTATEDENEADVHRSENACLEESAPISRDQLSNGALAALMQSNLDTAAVLIEQGADVNYHSKRYGHTVLGALMLSKASCRLFTDEGMVFFKYLLDQGALVNARDRSGFTCLHQLLHNAYDNFRHADSSKVIAAVDLLLTNGADIVALDNSGFTPLRRAVQLHRETRGIPAASVIFHLLQHGAGVFQPIVKSPTSFQRLVHRHSPGGDPLWYIQINIELSPCPVRAAAAQGQVEIVRVLLESGACSNKNLFLIQQALQLQARVLNHPAISYILGSQEGAFNAALSMISEAASTPRSLKSCCRLAVWRLVGCGLGRKEMIASLGLPTPMQEYVLFRDVIPTQ